jgi:glycine/D-amino acid oxidase-like deaminating enzyme
MVNERGRDAAHGGKGPVTIFGPDFPFPFETWITHSAGLVSNPAERRSEEVAVVGAGISGLVAAYELMRLGLKPVVYEASDGRAVAFAGVRGSRGRSRGTGDSASRCRPATSRPARTARDAVARGADLAHPEELFVMGTGLVACEAACAAPGRLDLDAAPAACTQARPESRN